jgi:hypothetical protein
VLKMDEPTPSPRVSTMSARQLRPNYRTRLQLSRRRWRSGSLVRPEEGQGTHPTLRSWLGRPQHKGSPPTLTCDQRASDVAGLICGPGCGVRFHRLRTCRRVGPRPRWADFVAKVWRLGAVNFFRTVQASLEKSCGGPQKRPCTLPATSPIAWRRCWTALLLHAVPHVDFRRLRFFDFLQQYRP